MTDAPFDTASDLIDAPFVGSRLRPKDAATLLVIRTMQGKPHVLMGRRSKGQAFMASKWVFPGGRIDRADFTARAATELRHDTSAGLAPDARRARALAMAAIRETFEETGLRLARPGSAAPGAGSWRPFREDGALPDLAALDYIGRAITPPGRPRRFDARFLMADADALTSHDPVPGAGEFEEAAWIALEDTKAFDLPAITRFILAEAEARLSEPNRPRPFVRFVRGQHVIEHT